MGERREERDNLGKEIEIIWREGGKERRREERELERERGRRE